MVDRLRWGNSRHGVMTRIGLVALWLVAGRFLLLILVFWLLLVYPLIKVYEYLTLGDLHAKAGLPGARRGGMFGFRRWPFGARFGIFAFLCVAFWGGLFLLFRDEMTAGFVAVVLGVAAMWFLGMFVVRSMKRSYRQGVARRREKKFQRRMKSGVS